MDYGFGKSCVNRGKGAAGCPPSSLWSSSFLCSLLIIWGIACSKIAQRIKNAVTTYWASVLEAVELKFDAYSQRDLDHGNANHVFREPVELVEVGVPLDYAVGPANFERIDGGARPQADFGPKVVGGAGHRWPLH